MAEKENTAPSLSNLLDIYNDALKTSKPSKYNNIEFEVRFKRTQASSFDKLYDELIMRGFNVEFSNYLLRVNVTYQKQDGLEALEGKDPTSNIRVELDDMNHIQELCKKNTLNSNARFVSKRAVDEKHNAPYMIKDYNMRVSIQKETERLPQSSEQVLHIQNRWDNSYKVFRYIYRTSLVHKDLPNIRIDLSKIRTNRIKSVYFMDSNVLSSDETYEIEIELININRPFDNGKKAHILKQLKDSVKFVLSSLQGSLFPVKYSELDEIYKNYIKLIQQSRKDAESNTMMGGAVRNDKKKRKKDDKTSKNGRDFIGPSSYTLQSINFVDDETVENVCLQRDSFCVTDKADGERKMLFIDVNNKLYFINTNLEIQFTGITIVGLANYANTLLDGEYITTNKYGDQISLYAAFDIYYYEGKDIRHRPFKNAGSNEKIETRHELLEKVIDNINENIKQVSETNPFKLSLKKFFFSERTQPESLFIANKKCLEHSKSLEYETDGLIFTPMELGVTQEIKGEPVKTYKYTWGKSFKWKPPEFNTIDFLISVEKDAFNKPKMKQKLINDQLVNYYILKLFVGVDKINHGITGSQQKLLNEEFIQVNSGEVFDSLRYRAEEFYPTNPADPLAHLCHVHLHLHEGKMKMFTEENHIIEDDTIIEFRYDVNTSDKLNSWIPLRVRYDKTKEYKMKKNNFGNAYHVANSNWHSIHNPITADILTGINRITSDHVLNANSTIYYNNNKNIKRENSHTIKLRKFHNFVKETIIRYASSKKENSMLIDMAVGKAGDLHKWMTSNIRGVLGIDISEDNIHNPHDGACKRYIELFSQKKTKKNNIFGMFISGDTSKSIEHGRFDIYRTKNENSISSNYILKCLMGTIEMHKIEEDYLKNNYNIFADKFDICSIQFAIHYMFENKEKLYNFAKNVSDMTHVGSYFIGTCYDGKAVYNELKDVDYDESVDLFKGHHKIWSIRKKYQDTDDSFLENSELSLGRKISVFQESINKEFDEYLVNFDYFVSVMNDHGFVLDNGFAVDQFKLSATETFENIYNALYKKGDKLNMTEEEKKISFLNKCFVFKKVSNIVKSYVETDEENTENNFSTSVGFPRKTKQVVVLEQL